MTMTTWHLEQVYRLRKEVERQGAQIERMRAALAKARPLIAGYEKALAAVTAAAGNPMPREEAMAFDRLRTALRMIDEAMGDEDER